MENIILTKDAEGIVSLTFGTVTASEYFHKFKAQVCEDNTISLIGNTDVTDRIFINQPLETFSFEGEFCTDREDAQTKIYVMFYKHLEGDGDGGGDSMRFGFDGEDTSAGAGEFQRNFNANNKPFSILAASDMGLSAANTMTIGGQTTEINGSVSAKLQNSTDNYVESILAGSRIKGVNVFLQALAKLYVNLPSMATGLFLKCIDGASGECEFASSGVPTRNSLTKTLATTLAVSQTDVQIVSLAFTNEINLATTDMKITLFYQFAPTGSGSISYVVKLDFDSGAGSPTQIGFTMDTGGVSSRAMTEIFLGSGRGLVKTTVNKVTGLNNAVVPSMYSFNIITALLKNPIRVLASTDANTALSDIRCQVQYDKY